jgi:hypothetical protein
MQRKIHAVSCFCPFSWHFTPIQARPTLMQHRGKLWHSFGQVLSVVHRLVAGAVLSGQAIHDFSDGWVPASTQRRYSRKSLIVSRNCVGSFACPGIDTPVQGATDFSLVWQNLFVFAPLCIRKFVCALARIKSPHSADPWPTRLY